MTSYDIIEDSPLRISIIDKIRSYLRLSLLEFMIPNYFIIIQKFPLNSSGKIDRNQLPDPTTYQRSFISETLQTSTEQSVALIWKKLLDIDEKQEIDRNDHFFLLGGHSLLAIRLQSQIRKELGLEIALNIIFDNPILKDLSKKISLMSKSSSSFLLKPISSSISRLPLSFAQQRLWFLDKLFENKSVYHIPTIYKLKGDLKLDILQKSIERIIFRHDSLRTVFKEIEGNFFFKIIYSLN
jgi:acyl carrier protein